MIGTANSLTGVLAPFELAINDGMDVAADDINAAGGVDGRKIKIIHVDAKSDLNLSATAALEVIEKGAQIVVPICDADLGGARRTRRKRKGILAITCAGAPGIGRQTIGPLTFNTYTGAPTESAINAEYAYRTKGWRRAYLLCDQLLEYTKVVCEAFKTRWKELGGEIVGEDTFLQSDASIASQVTTARERPQARLRHARARSREARRRSRRSAPPTTGRSCSPRRTRARSGSRRRRTSRTCGSRPSARATATIRAPTSTRSSGSTRSKTGEPAIVDSYPLLGYSLVQTIAKGIEIAGTTDGKAARGSARDVQGRPAACRARRPTRRTATSRSGARC